MGTSRTCVTICWASALSDFSEFSLIGVWIERHTLLGEVVSMKLVVYYGLSQELCRHHKDYIHHISILCLRIMKEMKTNIKAAILLALSFSIFQLALLMPTVQGTTQCNYTSGWYPPNQGWNWDVKTQSSANVYICETQIGPPRWILQAFHEGSRWGCCNVWYTGNLYTRSELRDNNFNLGWSHDYVATSGGYYSLNGPIQGLGAAAYACTKSYSSFQSGWPWNQQWTTYTPNNCLYA